MIENSIPYGNNLLLTSKSEEYLRIAIENASKKIERYIKVRQEIPYLDGRITRALQELYSDREHLQVRLKEVQKEGLKQA